MAFTARDIKDRVVQYPRRYNLKDTSSGTVVATYDLEAVAGTVLEVGTAINKAYLQPIEDYLKGIKIEDIDKLKINALLTQLQLSANTANIDAWADLLGDNSLINTSTSSDYAIVNGELVTEGLVDFPLGSSASASINLKNDGTNIEIANIITTPVSEICKIKSIKVKLLKVGNPTDSVGCQIRTVSGGVPSGTVVSATNVIAGSTITTSLAEYTFNFNDYSLSPNTQYAIVFYGTNLGYNNYYKIGTYSDSTPNGYGFYYGDYADGASYGWANLGVSLHLINTFIIRKHSTLTATIIWKSVTSSMVLEKMAIVAEQTLNAGTVTWYVSDDGTNWVTITNLKQMYTTNFDATNVYLKCVITGDATVSEVAYGG